MQMYPAILRDAVFIAEYFLKSTRVRRNESIINDMLRGSKKIKAT